MTVLKKFGFSIVFLTFSFVAATAQNAETCEKQVKAKTVNKIDPIDFVQNYLLNTKAPQNKVDVKTTVNKNGSTVTTTTIIKKEATVAKKVEVKKEEPSFAAGVLDWVKDKYSAMLDVMPNQISNVMLYRFIDEWYGVRYRMGGTSKSGIDCSAFVQNLYRYVFGQNLLRTACLQFNSAKYIKDMADLKEGDLVFFRVNTSRISHVGVYLKNNFFVHSASSKGVSIANLNNAYWSKYYAGGGRVIEQ